MKLIISLIVFHSMNSFAGYIQLEFTKLNLKYQAQIKEHLMENYNIPKSLIKTKVVKSCINKNVKNMVQMCFENKKGPQFYSDPNIIKSLLVFGELK